MKVVDLSPQASRNLHRGGNTRLCVLMLTTYVYDWTADTFVPLPRMPRDLPMQLAKAKKALTLIDKGTWQNTLLLLHNVFCQQ